LDTGSQAAQNNDLCQTYCAKSQHGEKVQTVHWKGSQVKLSKQAELREGV
jgi:hypothetical protein